ncbi:LuxR C-terminal-related transcriptional regulator [Francisellaceae bacterium]|nr:LuxR C-terminal-related transcriptional regulator [Francisellaceae bacterium]
MNLSQLQIIEPKDTNNIKMLLTDSRIFLNELNYVRDILSIDNIYHITWMRIFDDSSFQLVTQIPEKSYIDYILKGHWLDDVAIKPQTVSAYKTVYHEAPNELTKQDDFDRLMENKLSLMFSKLYGNIFDHFIFDIDQNSYEQLTEANKSMLCDRLNTSINLMYKNIHFTKTFKATGYQLIYPSEVKERRKAILEKFKLTEGNLDYLTAISSGCSAKEIAQKRGYSYRSVEDAIARLCVKLECQNKQQLVDISRIITSYLY